MLSCTHINALCSYSPPTVMLPHHAPSLPQIVLPYLSGAFVVVASILCVRVRKKESFPPCSFLPSTVLKLVNSGWPSSNTLITVESIQSILDVWSCLDVRHFL